VKIAYKDIEGRLKLKIKNVKFWLKRKSFKKRLKLDEIFL